MSGAPPRGGRAFALVLAGGESRRMGGPKLLLEHRGRSLLAGAVERAAEACDAVLVVVGAHADLYGPVARDLGARVVANDAWSEGLASSLRAGVAARPDDADLALVLLADQPFVPTSHLLALLAAGRGGAALAFSRYPGGALGAPAAIHRDLFGAVGALRGDRGARALLPHAERASLGVAEVALADPFDVDTPGDAARLDPGGRPAEP